MAAIRPYRPADRDGLYEICLKTGDGRQGCDPSLPRPGTDRSYLCRALCRAQPGHRLRCRGWGRHRRLHHRPCRHAKLRGGLRGRVVAGLARPLSRAGRSRPRRRCAHAPADPSSAAHVPRAIAESHPAHLHINLLPHLQGQGWGRGLIDTWRAKIAALGAPACHLAVGLSNPGAIAFYRAYGFHRDRPLRGAVQCHRLRHRLLSGRGMLVRFRGSA